MNTVTINGKEYTSKGNIVVKNNVVYIDGKQVDHGGITNGILRVHVSGDLASLEADGDVECHNVHGNVQAGGDVSCLGVGKNVQCGGDVEAAVVHGKIMAGGDVTHG